MSANSDSHSGPSVLCVHLGFIRLVASPQQTFFAHPGFFLLPTLLWEMQPVFSKSDPIRPANWWQSSHHSTLQARVQMLFGLSANCSLCLFVFPRILPPLLLAFHHLPNGEAGCSPPQAGIHLPSLTLSRAIKLLLQDRGGEKNENSAQRAAEGKWDSPGMEPLISRAKKKRPQALKSRALPRQQGQVN